MFIMITGYVIRSSCVQYKRTKKRNPSSFKPRRFFRRCTIKCSSAQIQFKHCEYISVIMRDFNFFFFPCQKEKTLFPALAGVRTDNRSNDP